MESMAIHRRGSGTVYLRNGVWWMQYFVRGRRVRESSGFAEKTEALNLLKQRIGEVAAGRRVGPEKVTIADLCELVIADHRLRNLRDLKHVGWRLESNIKPIIGSLLATRFGPSQIRQYIERRRAAGALNATINRELAIVRRGFRLGAQEDPPLVLRQPAIRKLEEDNVRQGFIERAQYEALLAELPDNLKALFVCGYHVGARKNELRRIKWPQVDFAASLIRLTVGQTKGKQSRTLPIYGDMRQWIDTQHATAPPDSPYVFHGSRGYPVDNHLLGWDEACVRAGLPGLMFHDLRRSAVRNMKRAGIQDVVAMRITGHKTRAVFDRYNIVDETDLNAAADKLEKYFDRESKPTELRRVK